MTLTRRQRIGLGVGGVLIFVATFGGPYVSARFAAEGAYRSTQNGTQIAQLQQTSDGVKALLQFVASTQTNGQARTNADLTRWVVAEMRATCAATPGCRQVPLPPSLGGTSP